MGALRFVNAWLVNAWPVNAWPVNAWPVNAWLVNNGSRVERRLTECLLLPFLPL
jgi:hypothetical protein